MEGIKLGEELGLVNNVHVGVDQDPAHTWASHHMTKVGPGFMIRMGMQAAEEKLIGNQLFKGFLTSFARFRGGFLSGDFTLACCQPNVLPFTLFLDTTFS